MEMFERAPGTLTGLNSFDYSFNTNDADYQYSDDSNPGLKVWAGTTALVAGTVVVSLAALPRTGRTALDLTGLTVLAIRIRNNGANTMTFTNPATNGYPFFAATNGHPIMAGDDFQQATRRPAGFGTVAAADLNIQADGTLVQTFTMGIIAATPA
jgi:hypothetical protein